ncbi:hypothetical protein AVEN_160564-1 [Araneus ventricosus]|uniref:Uncharacterized protein n=1 Tax=Araneus ventricosus TaxID=182803 RepID=A0A4Y2LCH5_ARAVE|nr:hypothetical protein AVEN_160564-1 [Araneus ventricosus]
MGVWWKRSNNQDNGERRFIHKYAGTHDAQAVGTIALAQINNANRQQITKDDCNSTFKRSAPQLRLLAKLQLIPRRRSHSKDVPRRILLPSIYSVPDRA